MMEFDFSRAMVPQNGSFIQMHRTLLRRTWPSRAPNGVQCFGALVVLEQVPGNIQLRIRAESWAFS